MDGTTIGAFEAKTHFSKLLERVHCGETFVITRRGEEVARLVPMDDRGRAKAAIERVEELTRDFSLGGLSWKDLRDEGRR